MISLYQFFSAIDKTAGSFDVHFALLNGTHLSVTMSTTALSDKAISLKGEHHRHSSTRISAPPSAPTAISQAQQVPASHLSHVDRDSAITLGILLILIIAAALYYTHLHLKHKRQDIERQAEQDRRDSLPRRLFPESTGPNIAFRMGSMWSKCSSTPCRSESTVGENKNLKKELRVDSGATTMFGSIDQESFKFAPSRSPFPHSQPASSSPRSSSASSRRASHRRQPSVHSIPAALIANQRRPSWNDTLRRGSVARPDRRFSSLATIHEPDAACYQNDVEIGGARYDWTRPTGMLYENAKPPSAASTASAAGKVKPACIVPGVLPDLPSDEEESVDEIVVLGDFRGVVWNRNTKSGSGVEYDLGPAPDERDVEKAQRVSWAKTDALGASGPRRHT